MQAQAPTHTMKSNEDGTYSVSGIGACMDTQLIIPEITPNGDRVTAIASSAFKGVTTITSVEIPASVTLIGESAFNNCTGLTEFEIPNGVTSIKSSTFYGCTNLTNVVFHDNVTSIGSHAFDGCTGLTDIVFPTSVTSVGSFAYSNCTNLANVYYKGSSSDWDNLTINNDNDKFRNAERYYYSEVEPTTIGKFWHYVDDVITVWPEYVPSERNLAFTSNKNGTCKVSGIGDYVDATEIVIPSTSPDGDTVTSIGAEAFKLC